MSLGHWIEMRSIIQARGALTALAELLPDSAERVTDSGLESVPLDELHVGDVVLVRPGARVPADGDVIEGTADLDESMISGESRPVTRQSGDHVVAGTVAAGGSLRVRGAAVGEETALSGILRLVAEAQRLEQPSPAAGGPRGGAALLRGAGLGRHHARRSGPCSATPKRRSFERPPCWSSPARTHLAWRSRW